VKRIKQMYGTYGKKPWRPFVRQLWGSGRAAVGQ
jgi:hypothetical protein